MAINYIEKGPGLRQVVLAQGHQLYQLDGIWKSSDDVAVQAIIDSYDELAARKIEKADEIKAEGLKHINAVFPALDSLDEIQLVAEFWLSIAPAARQPTADFQSAIDIYSAAKAGIIAVNALDLASVQAFDPIVDVGWPA